MIPPVSRLTRDEEEEPVDDCEEGPAEAADEGHPGVGGLQAHYLGNVGYRLLGVAPDQPGKPGGGKGARGRDTMWPLLLKKGRDLTQESLTTEHYQSQGHAKFLIQTI